MNSYDLNRHGTLLKPDNTASVIVTESLATPNSASIGDVWIDTGTVSAAQMGINITESLATPASPTLGDMWLDTGTISTSQMGINIVESLATPISPVLGDMWLDTGLASASQMGINITESLATPASPVLGDMWLDTGTVSTSQMGINIVETSATPSTPLPGDMWIDTGTVSATQAALNFSEAAVAPLNPLTGDMWIDTVTVTPNQTVPYVQSLAVTSPITNTGTASNPVIAIPSGTLVPYGAVVVAGDTAAQIQAKADACATAGTTLAIPDGTWALTTGVTFACNVVATPGAIFTTTQANIVAITLGSTTANVGPISARLPQVLQSSKTWGGNDIGVRIANLVASKVDVPSVSRFSVGLQEIGMGGKGCSYNSIFIGILSDNKINEQVTTDGVASSYCNEINHFGGQFSFIAADGVAVAGTRQISIPDQPYNQINNHRWWGPSLEGDVPEYHVECYGTSNYFNQARWETGAPSPKVHWGKGTQTASNNIINGGYNVNRIVQTYDAGTSRNFIINSPNGSEAKVTSGTTGVVESNTTSSAYPVRSVVDPSFLEGGGNPATGYRWQQAGDGLGGKRSADAYNRLYIDNVNGRYYMGTGVGAPVAYIGAVGSEIGVVGSNFDFLPDNTLDIGASSLRPRYIRAGTSVVTGSGATASRPSAVTAGVGAAWYDTTLTKPIWSDGAVWRDSAGTVV